MSVLRRLLVAVAVVALALGAGATGAAAHGGGALFEVEEAAETAPGEVSVRVVVSHESDRHPADGAIVEVAAKGPGGATVAPRQAERQAEPGTYATTLPIPAVGDWVVSVTSSFPQGSLDIPVTVALADADADATTTTTAAAAPSPTPPADDGGAAGGASAGSGDRVPVPGAVEDDPVVELLVAGVFGLIGGALGLWASNRRGRRKRAEAAGHS